MSDEEHYIQIESTQVFAAEVGPNEPERLTNDAEVYNQTFGKTEKVGYDMHFDRELKRTFECTCGAKFRKPETARAHLEDPEAN